MDDVAEVHTILDFRFFVIVFRLLDPLIVLPIADISTFFLLIRTYVLLECFVEASRFPDASLEVCPTPAVD